VTRGIPQPCKAEALADRRYVAERQRAKSGEQQVSHLNDHSGAGNEISKESEEKKTGLPSGTGAGKKVSRRMLKMGIAPPRHRHLPLHVRGWRTRSFIGISPCGTHMNMRAGCRKQFTADH